MPPKRGFMLMYPRAPIDDPMMVEAEDEVACARRIDPRLTLCNDVECQYQASDMRHSHIPAKWFPRERESYRTDDPMLAGWWFRRFRIFDGEAHIPEHNAGKRRRSVLLYYRAATFFGTLESGG